MPAKGFRKPVIDTERLLDAAVLLLKEVQSIEPQSMGLTMALSGIELARRKTLPPTE